MRGYGIVAVTAAALCLGWASDVALAQDDSYIRGYVSAVAEREFGLPPGDVDVQPGGVVRIHTPHLSPDQRARLADALRTVRGVTDIRITTDDAATPAPAAPLSTAPPAASPQSSPVPHAATPPPPPPPPGPDGVDVPAAVGDDQYRLGLLPGKTLFDPLIADPNWPQIAGTYRAYQGSDKFADTGAADFGGSLALYRFQGPGGQDARSELGIQAAVFSTFDLDAESHDLVNADYFVSLTDTWRAGRFSVIGRVLHQSSHLGDEYLLAHINDPGFQRVNLSYEQLDAIASYDLTRSWRIYGGGGILFDTDPVDLGNWSLQYGVEYTAPFTLGDHLRPVAAADVKHKEYEDWNLDLSLRAGVQIEGAELRGNRLLLLFEYYAGHDPNGQFFTDSVQWYGVGLHWFF